MFSRSPARVLKTVTRSRSLTQATATLRISPKATQQVQCTVAGTPDYMVVVPRSVGCALSGRDLDSKDDKVNLIFYAGCHFAYDKHPQTPRLTLTQEVAFLMDRSDGMEVPAVLFYDGDMEGSAITLRGTDGEKMMEHTAAGIRAFRKAIRDMK